MLFKEYRRRYPDHLLMRLRPDFSWQTRLRLRTTRPSPVLNAELIGALAAGRACHQMIVRRRGTQWYGMDEPTRRAYDRDAKAFADKWEAQPPPSDLYDVIRRFFIPGQPTADIGCGSGRDVAWLHACGYPAIGFDVSEGLLAEARRQHPEIDVRTAVLPRLDGIEESTFANVLCETVIMHLEPNDVPAAVKRLLAILVPGGILYLSWRLTEGGHRRDEHGRLYAAFEPEQVLDALTGAQVLLDERVGSVSSGKLIRRIVVRKA